MGLRASYRSPSLAPSFAITTQIRQHFTSASPRCPTGRQLRAQVIPWWFTECSRVCVSLCDIYLIRSSCNVYLQCICAFVRVKEGVVMCATLRQSVVSDDAGPPSRLTLSFVMRFCLHILCQNIALCVFTVKVSVCMPVCVPGAGLQGRLHSSTEQFNLMARRQCGTTVLPSSRHILRERACQA